MNTKQCVIKCCWDSRSESKQSLADRCLQMIGALNEIESVSGSWRFSSRACGEPKLIDAIGDELPELIHESCMQRMRDGSPSIFSGFMFSLVDAEPEKPNKLFGTIIAGADTGGRPAPTAFANNVVLNTTDLQDAPGEPELAAYETFRSMMLAIFRSWDASFCCVYPRDLQATWPEGRKLYFFSTWMTLLAPELATHITPTEAVEVEHLPDGNLLLIATRDRFDVTNPSHLAAAQAIQTALAPLNDLRRSMTW